MKKVAVVLSGCGVFDGSEINEVVLTLLSLEEYGVDYQCYAPDKPQFHTVNHLDSNEEDYSRNVLNESARIVRGNVLPLSQLKREEYAGLLVPGGFGVAKNLSTFATEGEKFIIDEEFKAVMTKFAVEKKPVGYLCIAPVLLPHVYEGVRCTIGNDESTKRVIEGLGGVHVDCAVDEIVFDEAFNVITTPAYMLAENIAQTRKGIDKLVKKLSALL